MLYHVLVLINPIHVRANIEKPTDFITRKSKGMGMGKTKKIDSYILSYGNY